MLTIVDSHVHFWDTGRFRYAWLDELPALNRPYLPDHVPQGGPGWRVEALVFMQADCAPQQGLAEVDWVASLAAADPRIQGVVAFAPLEQGERVRPLLDELARRPLVKGVRRLIQSEQRSFCLQPGFVAGVRALADYGWGFDVCIRHDQMRDAIQLVAQCPTVRFVLDHAGKPDIRAGLRCPWWEDIAELAALPNVACKLSGLVTEADWQRWQAADLRPYIDRVLEVFGVERVMFGSDSPVQRLATSYPHWIETLLAALESLSQADRERTFSANAIAFYRLASEAGTR